MEYLAASYFHQDYRLESDSPIGNLGRFLENEGAAAGQELLSEIQVILSCDMSESEIREIWIETYRSAYNPGVDGITNRKWMECMAAFLASHLDGL
ncbi:contact-dependent growth inhibition system immunity protein [Kitasatospora herbaricolor]